MFVYIVIEEWSLDSGSIRYYLGGVYLTKEDAQKEINDRSHYDPYSRFSIVERAVWTGTN